MKGESVVVVVGCRGGRVAKGWSSWQKWDMKERKNKGVLEQWSQVTVRADCG